MQDGTLTVSAAVRRRGRGEARRVKETQEASGINWKQTENQRSPWGAPLAKTGSAPSAPRGRRAACKEWSLILCIFVDASSRSEVVHRSILPFGIWDCVVLLCMNSGLLCHRGEEAIEIMTWREVMLPLECGLFLFCLTDARSAHQYCTAHDLYRQAILNRIQI